MYVHIINNVQSTSWQRSRSKRTHHSYWLKQGGLLGWIVHNVQSWRHSSKYTKWRDSPATGQESSWIWCSWMELRGMWRACLVRCFVGGGEARSWWWEPAGSGRGGSSVCMSAEDASAIEGSLVVSTLAMVVRYMPNDGENVYTIQNVRVKCCVQIKMKTQQHRTFPFMLQIAPLKRFISLFVQLLYCLPVNSEDPTNSRNNLM